MEHSIALVTGTTSGLGYAAASMLAAKGYRQVIVTGRSLARVKETAAQLAAETKTQVFTPLEQDLDEPSSVQSALAALAARRLPSGMAVYAVSPGAATATKAARNAGPAVKYLMVPLVSLIPGMNQTPETAARR
jgi:short-subunit dehydrogenase